MSDEPEVQEDEKAKAPRKPRKAETVRARVLRDFWPTDNDLDRVRAGAEVEVSLEALIEGMESGVLERIKD